MDRENQVVLYSCNGLIKDHSSLQNPQLLFHCSTLSDFLEQLFIVQSCLQSVKWHIHLFQMCQEVQNRTGLLSLTLSFMTGLWPYERTNVHICNNKTEIKSL